MRRTIAQAALVFTSALLIMALAGCGGSSKKTAAGDPDPGGMIPAPGTPTPDPPAISGLPTGHTLQTGTVDAGASVTVLVSKGKRTVLTCPAGGEACAITVAADRSATSTGGTPTVGPATTNELVFQANNGPDGTSNGAHAVGLVNRLTHADSGIATPTDYARAAVAAMPSAVPPVVGNPAANGNTQGTVATSQPVAVVKWTRGNRPEFELNIPNTVFTGLGGQPATSGDLELDSHSQTPSLGTGWNGASMSGSFLDGAKTMRAVIYTDADKPTGDQSPDLPRLPVAAGLDLSSDSDWTGELAKSTSTSGLEFGISSEIGRNVMVTVPADDVNRLREGTAQTADIDVTVEYEDAGGQSRTRAAKLACAVILCRVVGGQLQGTWSIVAQPQSGMHGTADDAHLILGAWMVLPKDSSAPASSATSYNLGSFAYSVVGATSGGRINQTALNSIGGDGNYMFTGPATGLYMTGEYRGAAGSTARRLVNAQVGSFTADVELTAVRATTFTGVSGTISDFEENGADLDWEMSLTSTGPGAAGTDILFTGETVLETSGGAEATGMWGVSFYWEDGIGIEHAAGTFNASNSDTASSALQVVGAFGTERQGN